MIKNIMCDEQVQLYLSNVQGRFLQRVQGIVFMSYIGLAAYSIYVALVHRCHILQSFHSSLIWFSVPVLTGSV